jgi:energy-coupling factor transporter ATP-binding protein EcfA2
MQLKTVSISGFRSIESVSDVHIGKPTLITGQNDGGKSSFLLAVQFLLNAYVAADRDHTYTPQPSQATPEDQADPDDPADPDGETGCPRQPEVVVEGVFTLKQLEQDQLGLPTEVTLRRRHLLGGGASYEIEKEVPSDSRLRDPESLRVDELKALCTEFGLATTGLKAELVERLQVKARTVETTVEWVPATPALVKALPSLLIFSSENAADADESIRRLLSATYKSHLQHESIAGRVQEIEQQLDELLAGDVKAIIEHVQDRCADVGSISIQPNSSLSAGVRDALITVSNSAGQEIRLAEAGAGRSRRISLAVWEAAGDLLNGQGDAVVIYDEPDTHLDYHHQRDLMKVILEQASLPDTKVIVATHSMNLIDGVDIADVLHFTLDSDRTAVRVLRDDSETGRHLGSIAASLGLRNTTLLHERLFVGVEGITEMACLPILFRLATGKQLESCGIALWACGNNEGAVNFAAFLKAHHRNVVFLCDHDSVKNCPKVFAPERLRARGFDPDNEALYLGNPNEIEDLFDDQVWARVANAVWPLPDGRSWNPREFSVHRDGKFSSQVLEMLRTESQVGPGSKEDVMTQLALKLSKAEMPSDLTERFAELQALAES